MSTRLPENPVARQLKIKLGVVQRTQKELQSYHAELEKQKAKVDGMRASGADEYDIKKQVEVQGESEMMIPDTMRRLDKGVEDLKGFLALNAEDPAIAGSEQLAAAQQLVQQLGGEEAAAGADEDDRI